MAQNKGDAQDNMNLKVLGQDGTSIEFRIKKDMALKKLMNAYCTRMGLDMATVRFRFDGHGINVADTPSTLELEDRAIIDVYHQETGGFRMGKNYSY